MLGLFRRIRTKLWLISYYSASRRRNTWTRALGWALFASLLLPTPLVMVGEALSEHTATLDQRSGGLEGEDGGPFEALVRDTRDPNRRLAWGNAPPYAEWTLQVVERRRGWPFASTREESGVRLDLDLFDETTVRVDAKLPVGSPVRLALEDALSDRDHQRILAAWHLQTTGAASRDWLGTMTNFVVWWIGLSVFSFLAVRVLFLGARARRLLVVDRRAARRDTGRCAVCDYDLRGLEFNERCPECGSLLH